MQQKKLNALFLIGMIGVFTVGSNFAIQLYRAFGEDQNIWWTARTMPLKINETKDLFELFINDKSIYEHLAHGTLLIRRGSNVNAPISSGDITVRINNWYQVKSSILANALTSCFLFSACLTTLIIGIIQIISKKNEDCQQGASSDASASHG
jgi:hypothetical protein